MFFSDRSSLWVSEPRSISFQCECWLFGITVWVRRSLAAMGVNGGDHACLVLTAGANELAAKFFADFLRIFVGRVWCRTTHFLVA